MVPESLPAIGSRLSSSQLESQALPSKPGQLMGRNVRHMPASHAIEGATAVANMVVYNTLACCSLLVGALMWGICSGPKEDCVKIKYMGMGCTTGGVVLLAVECLVVCCVVLVSRCSHTRY
jgi:hypothetical protein